MGGTGRAGHGRASWAIALLLVPVLLATLGEAGYTHAQLSDMKQEMAAFGASGPTPPSISPGAMSLTLHVGDRCESAPLASVRTSSGWRVTLSVTAEGWLEPGDVTIMPPNIGPGEVAIVYFTKAAVGPPHPITGQVIVTAQPGGFQTGIALSGEVTNPANASEHHEHPTGCDTTPRAKETEAETTETEATQATANDADAAEAREHAEPVPRLEAEAQSEEASQPPPPPPPPPPVQEAEEADTTGP